MSASIRVVETLIVRNQTLGRRVEIILYFTLVHSRVVSPNSQPSFTVRSLVPYFSHIAIMYWTPNVGKAEE